MTRAEIRYAAHATLNRVERLDWCIAPRTPDKAEEIEFLIDDIKKALLRIIGTFPTDKDLAKAEAEDDED